MKQKKTLTDFKAENERLPSDREIFVCGFRSGARFSEYVGCAFGGPSPFRQGMSVFCMATDTHRAACARGLKAGKAAKRKYEAMMLNPPEETHERKRS